MPLPSGHIVTADELAAATDATDFQSTACSLSTTSATYVDVTGASFSFTKRLGSAASNIVVDVSVMCFVGTSASDAAFAVNINGTDVFAAQLEINNVSVHTAAPLGTALFTGLAANTYTVKLRAKRLSGTGTITINSSDFIQMRARERLI